jgi:hypothetical protein
MRYIAHPFNTKIRGRVKGKRTLFDNIINCLLRDIFLMIGLVIVYNGRVSGFIEIDKPYNNGRAKVYEVAYITKNGPSEQQQPQEPQIWRS